MDNIKASLLNRNTIKNITDEEHLKNRDYLEVINAFTRLTYESIYVIDYEKMGFEYVSENPLFLCGLSAKEVQSLYYVFYVEAVKYSPSIVLHGIRRYVDILGNFINCQPLSVKMQNLYFLFRQAYFVRLGP